MKGDQPPLSALPVGLRAAAARAPERPRIAAVGAPLHVGQRPLLSVPIRTRTAAAAVGPPTLDYRGMADRVDLNRTNPDDRRPVIATLDGRLDASAAHD
jgi:hypothetical protein